MKKILLLLLLSVTANGSNIVNPFRLFSLSGEVFARAFHIGSQSCGTAMCTLELEKKQDPLNLINETNERFTAPSSGYYFFYTRTHTAAIIASSTTYYDFYVNGSSANFCPRSRTKTANYPHRGSAVLYLNTNDYVELRIRSSNNAITTANSSTYNTFNVIKLNNVTGFVKASNGVNSSGTIIFGTEISDPDGVYDHTTGLISVGADKLLIANHCSSGVQSGSSPWSSGYTTISIAKSYAGTRGTPTAKVNVEVISSSPIGGGGGFTHIDSHSSSWTMNFTRVASSFKNAYGDDGLLTAAQIPYLVKVETYGFKIGTDSGSEFTASTWTELWPQSTVAATGGASVVSADPWGFVPVGIVGPYYSIPAGYYIIQAQVTLQNTNAASPIVDMQLVDLLNTSNSYGIQRSIRSELSVEYGHGTYDSIHHFTEPKLLVLQVRSNRAENKPTTTGSSYIKFYKIAEP